MITNCFSFLQLLGNISTRLILVPLIPISIVGCSQDSKPPINENKLFIICGLGTLNNISVLQYDPPRKKNAFETWVLYSENQIFVYKNIASNYECIPIRTKTGLEAIEQRLKRSIGIQVDDYYETYRWQTKKAKCSGYSVTTDQGCYFILNVNR